MPRIALVTTRELPAPDADDVALLGALDGASLVAWEDPEVEWAAFDAAVIRSAWNYHDHRDEFLAWTRTTAAVTTLLNPASTVAWNTDKRYLADLAAAGFRVVPTVFAAPDSEPDHAALGGRTVVKPSVGAGSTGARLFHDDPAAAREHVRALHRDGRTAMIQPYLDGVDTAGETALIYLDGEFSHAARKAPILTRAMSRDTGLYADEQIAATTATAAERALGDAILAWLPTVGHRVAYARVDLLPGPHGPVLLELELTEPSLFLDVAPEAAPRAAHALLGALARARAEQS